MRQNEVLGALAILHSRVGPLLDPQIDGLVPQDEREHHSHGSHDVTGRRSSSATASHSRTRRRSRAARRGRSRRHARRTACPGARRSSPPTRVFHRSCIASWRSAKNEMARRAKVRPDRIDVCGGARRSASNARHIAKQALIAAVRSGKSTRLWARIAAEAIEAARANGPASAVRQTRHTAAAHHARNRTRSRSRQRPVSSASSA